MQNKFTQPNRYVFYDIESASEKADETQIVQIAMIETDADLNILLNNKGEELAYMFYVKMRQDMIANPVAFLIHKVDPQWVGHSVQNKDYINAPDGPIYSEREASLVIKDILTRTGNTAIAGYNSDRFDDEILRHSFYRNMIDPYAHEWSNGNHRCDIYKVVQLCRMFSEKALNWPVGDDEKVSLKLEKLSVENGLVHEKAHDALSDIYATIFLAKLIKDRRPSIWDKYKMLSDKKHVDRLLKSGEVLSLTQTFIPKEQYGTTLMLPVAQDPVNKSKHYCIDVTGDMSPLMDMTSDQLREFLFTPKKDKTEEQLKIDFNIRSVAINKSPLINMPPMKSEDESRKVSLNRICERIDKSIEKVEDNIAFVRQNLKAIREKVQAIYNNPADYDKKPSYTGLYDGFFSDIEKFKRDGLLQRSNDGTFAIDNTDIFKFVDDLPVSDEVKMKHLELCIYSKWGAFNGEWADLSNISASDANELIIYQKFIADNFSGKGVGISVAEFTNSMNEIKERDVEVTDFEKYLLNALYKEVGNSINRYKELSKVLTPDVMLAAEVDRGNDTKYKLLRNLISTHDNKNEENTPSP